MVAFFIGAFQGMYVQPESLSGGENIDTAGFHGWNGFFGLSASVWIAGLTELAHAAAKGDGLIISVQIQLAAAGCGHGCCIPVMNAEQDAAGVAVQDRPCLVIRRSVRRTTVVFTIAAAAKLAFKDCPWCCYDFMRVDDAAR